MTTDRPLRVLILGAASGIAEATARLYAQEGALVGLAGRNAGRLASIADDLRARGAAQVMTFDVDFTTSAVPAALGEMVAALGGVDHVLLAYGILGKQETAETDLAAAQSIVDVNFRSATAWILAAAQMLERQGRGSLVVLGSVAGDRGRRSNYIYGATKAGLAVLVEGISHRFRGSGPKAVIVKPGPTDTAMTAAMAKGGPLWASPEAVAAVSLLLAKGLHANLVVVTHRAPEAALADTVDALGRTWIVEPVAERRELARQLGADAILDPSQVDVIAQVKRDTGNRGVDLVIDCAAKGGTINQSLYVARNAGRVVYTGIPSEAEVTLAFHEARRKELALFNVRRSNHETDLALSLMRDGIARFAPLLTHAAPLDRIGNAFDTLEHYRDGACKVTITV